MTHVRRSQAERRRRSRHAIIEAAMSLVADGEPFESLTIRDLAARSGLAPSGFYRYFTDMSGLERAIIEDSFASIHDLVEELAGQGGMPQLPGANVESLSTLIGRHRLPLAFLARQRIAGDRETRRQIRATIKTSTRRVAELLTDHPRFQQWPPADVTVLAELMTQVFLHAVDSYLTSADPETGAPDSASCHEIDDRARAQTRLLMAATRAWPAGRGEPGA